MLGRVWRASRESTGQSLVEFAMCVPLLVLIVLGIVEVGSAYTSYITLVNAGREGARLAARGNIFTPDQILVVIREHSAGIDLNGNGAINVTSVHAETTGITSYTTTKLLGSQDNRIDSTTLSTIWTQATSVAPSDPSFVRKGDEFVLVEVWYNYRTVTGFFAATIPMYSYTIMPVSAPS